MREKNKKKLFIIINMSSESPIVITYENDDTNTNSHNFFRTLKVNDWDFVRVGIGEKWEGFISKIHAYRKICDSFDDKKILIFSDARDVFCLRHPKAFVDAFRYLDCEILFSAEICCEGKLSVDDSYVGKQCTSLAPYFHYHKLKPPVRKFVNAGLIAGYTGALKNYWQWVIDNSFKDDQLAAGSFMNKFPEKVKLDSDALILHTSGFGVEGGIYAIHSQKHDAPTYSELFGCGAFFLHLPGVWMKGQRYLYEVINEHLGKHKSTAISELYTSRVPGWNDYNDLGKD